MKLTIVGVLGGLAVLFMAWAVAEDVSAPQAPLPENTVYYALSTIAQSAAALAAILGAFGLWRLDRLREVDRGDEDREHETQRELLKVQYELESAAEVGAVVALDPRVLLGAPANERMLQLRLTGIQVRRQAFGDEWRWLIKALVAFLLCTLGILVLAITGLAFVDTLCVWVSTIRTGITLAGLILGLGPAVMVWNVARRSRPPTILAGRTQDERRGAIVGPGGGHTGEDRSHGP